MGFPNFLLWNYSYIVEIFCLQPVCSLEPRYVHIYAGFKKSGCKNFMAKFLFFFYIGEL